MRLIGITGTIGCGKTTIANKFKELGCVVWDADAWVKKFYKKKNFLNIIEKNFPIAFENGVLNKRKLRNLVFNNQTELDRLEKIIHPLLNKQLKSYIKKFCKYDKIVFIDTPLLFEMEWNKYCYKIILADVDYQTAKQRVMLRDHISSVDFDKIYEKQIKNVDKKHLSDIIVNTDIPLNVLKRNLILVQEKL